MKVFVSWSGTRSRAVAEALGPWLRQMVQALDPWLSTQLQKGVRQGGEIAYALEHSRAGIICLTPENLSSPWINFEAGALSKVQDIHVCTILLDLTPGDVAEPLAQFQHTLANREDIRALSLTLADLARKHGDTKVTDADVAKLFEALWPGLASEIEAARSLPVQEKTAVRGLEEKVEEILQRVREIQAPSPMQVGAEERRKAKRIFAAERAAAELRRAQAVMSQAGWAKRTLLTSDEPETPPDPLPPSPA